jgi:hypothetical protein
MEATPIDIVQILDTHIITRAASPARIKNQETQHVKQWYLTPINSLDHMVGDIVILYDTEDILNIFTSKTHVEIASTLQSTDGPST